MAKNFDNNKIEAKVGILGGGLSGVTFQHFLKLNSEILEKEDRPGGLCRTWEVDGLQSDRGPHIIFSRDKDTLEGMKDILGENVQRLYRKNAIWYRNRFVKYPFENDLYALEPEDRFRCLRDFIFNPDGDRQVNNLEDWAYKMFGPSLARCYFLPYNEKIWKRPARELGTEWVERIPRPGTDEIIRSAVGVPTEGYRHQLYFYYPLKGGIEAMVKSLMGENARIRTRSAVLRLEKVNDHWKIHTTSGSRIYKHIVCCMPVQELIKALISPVPDAVRQATQRLRVNSLILVLMIYRCSEAPNRLAIYIPDSEVWPHRLSWVNYLDPQRVPPGYHAVLAEITTNTDHRCYKMADDVIAAETIRQLKGISILPKNAAVKAHVHREDYAYVVNCGNYERDRTLVLDFCRGLNIPMLGRWAEFAYLNMDAVWQKSKLLAAELHEKWG